MRITIARTARKMGILLTIGARVAGLAACGSNSKSTGRAPPGRARASRASTLR